MAFFENYGDDFMLYYRNHAFPSSGKNILHIHPHYEMLLIPTHNTYQHMINGKYINVNQPSVAIFSPFSMHHSNITPGDHIERILFYFGNTMINDHPAEFKVFEPYKKHMFFWTPLSDETVRELRPVLDLLADSYYTNDIITQKMLFLIVLNKILSLDNGTFMTTGDANIGNTSNIIRYMCEHLKENITAETVAQHFFISRSKLNKDFKQYTGISFHSLLTELKISRAKYLLIDGKTPIKEICSQIGVENETYFFAFFKKGTGLTPLQFAKNARTIPPQSNSINKDPIF